IATQGILELVLWGNQGTLAWQSEVTHGNLASADHQPPLDPRATELLDQLRTIWMAESNPPSQTPTHSLSAVAEAPIPLAPPYGLLLVSGDHTHQPGYADSLLQGGRCRAVGMTDQDDISPRRRQLNEQMAQRLGIPVLPLDAALRREDVHVVSICAEPIRRGPIIVEALKAGKHVYLDKPLAGTATHTQAIMAAAAQARVVTQMWSLVRSTAAARMRNAVETGRLGDLTAFHADLCFAKGTPGTAEPQVRQETDVPERYELMEAKRELTNVGVYCLVSLLWLTGKRIQRVGATTGNFFFREHQNNNMEDFGQMILELEGGMIATLSAGRSGWQSNRDSGLDKTTLVGTRSLETFDAHRPRLAVWSDAPAWSPPQTDPEDPMGMWGGPKKPEHVPAPKHAWLMPAIPAKDDFTHFLDCVQAGRASDVPAELASHATAALLAGYRSAATGKIVALD
ncbi:MAG: Gfo/Idh/MocA family oxidoreductase, partial [Pirellulales bacterium]|nr:Gfo/Idh/MocA family oxidoreductase [Pirellulales bacterium]